MRTIIIPDLHGHYYQFIKLLKKLDLIENGKIKIKNNEKIILLGDLIDKGPLLEQKMLIDFIYENKDSFIIIKGNHEENVMKFLNNKDLISEEKHDFFNIVLKTYPELESKFIEIYKKSLLYFEDDLFFCNHSPCLKEHILNKDNNLIKYSFKQYKDFESIDDYEKYFKAHFCSILENKINKIHVVGHMGLSKPMIFNNQIWLDTANLNELTFLIYENDSYYFFNDKFEKNEIFLIENLTDALHLIKKELKIK